ncbi:MAG TPA: hypothetical protein VK037_08240 [Pseudogracilibacillus sp.]|nr:hypothetical protein [Pseudogracilibacillus sp.]
MSLKRTIYRLLRLSNDINAIRRGRMGERMKRRAVRRATNRTIRNLFK